MVLEGINAPPILEEPEGLFMKITDKKKAINTIPKGVWESSRPVPDKDRTSTATETTDLQENGYPTEQSK